MVTREAIDQAAESQLEAQLLGLLTGALLDSPAKVDELHGCAPLETETITTEFLPPDKKITLTYNGEVEDSPTLYYIKTDTHDPNSFQMPDGKLKASELYDVTRIARSANGLVLAIGYQGRGYDFFYANSLDDLSIRVVEKSAAEKAQDQLREMDDRLDQYEYHIVMASQHQEAAEALEQAVQNLPVFDVDSTYRYSVDSSLAGTLYHMNESGLPELIQDWTFSNGSTMTGKFFGNRLAVVADKMLLIDDETNLAIGAVIIEEKRGAIGLNYLEAVNVSTLQSDHRDNSDLAARLRNAS